MVQRSISLTLWIVAVMTGVLTPDLCDAQGEDYYVIPYDVDPPIVIDGSLDDWANIPNVTMLNSKEQVTYGREHWTGPEDLSAKVHLAYRYDGLYIAAEVTDDVVYQPLTGGNFWKGDHVQILLDLIPGVNPERTAVKFQFGLSPGSFGEKSSGGDAIEPEIYVWRPAGTSQKGGQIAAKKTDSGYIIEAYIPFKRLQVPDVKMNQDANFEITVSDNDSAPPKQQTMLTRGTRKWALSRKRLLPVVFGNGNGKGTMPVRTVAIEKKAAIEESKTLTLRFNAEAIPAGKDPYIFFQARLDWEKVAGFRSALAVELNGKRISGDRISNRPKRSMIMSGNEHTFIAPDGRLTIPYTPNGPAFDSHPHYGIIGAVKGCEFEFNVAGLLKEGENTLVFHNLVERHQQDRYIVAVEDVELRIKAKGASAVAPKPAPTGPLPEIEPQKTFPMTYSNLTQKQASVEFHINSEVFSVHSTFTAPDGNKHKGSTKFYKHTRRVIEHDEWMEVRDTFKNLTNQNVPIIQTHSCALGEKRAKDVWLCCLKMPTGIGRKSEPSNPTVFAVTANSGVGMVALNDEFRIHSEQSAAKGTITLADRSFMLKAAADYTAEWAIVPVTKPDMWAFVNATRRLMDANFTLKIMFAFMFHRQPVYEWSDTMFKNFIERKSANLVSQSLYFARYKGRLPHGLAFNRLSEHYNYYTDFHKRLHRLFPNGSVKHAVYFHCYLDVIEENAERFKHCRRIDAAGNHMTYGSRPYLVLYVPTLKNAWGRAIGEGIDIRLDKIGADAIYWDEFNQSRGKYTYNMWDGCSADIDPATYKIRRLKGAVHLLSKDWLVYTVKRITERVPLILNGAPMSRTIANLNVQNFVETGSISACHSTILHSPVALGDHLTERTQKDAYEVMLRALDWGCLYSWYGSNVIPTHRTITERMFPFTPIELHSGYVIGRERILTNRSGLFGWGDNSQFKTYVYDRQGKATDGSEVRKVVRNGKSYAEVRIPEGYAAVLVRVRPIH